MEIKQEEQKESVSYETAVKQISAQIIQAAAGMSAQFDKKLGQVLDDFASGVNELTGENK